MDDYRRTKYCPELDNVRKKKEHIKNKIKEEHLEHRICILILVIIQRFKKRIYENI